MSNADNKVQVTIKEDTLKDIKNKQGNIHTDLIDQYLDKIDWQVKENANMAYSLQGMRNYIASESTKEYWTYKIYPEQIAGAHKEGDFHIHDMGELNAYCCGWDLQDLLRTGFTGVQGKISCAPPKHLHSALGQAVNFIYTLQGEIAGAVAFSNFDTLLAPFVKYDKLNYKQVKQALQTFVFNVNVPTRVGFQTPFFNITMDLNAPSFLAKQNVLIGGEFKKEKYGDFQKEMDMINRAFAEVMIEGDASDRIFTFPIPTYNIDKNFDWENPNYESIWEMTAKYGIPYFANFINSDMKSEDARSMCCRLRLDNRELIKRGGALFGSNPMTGSIGVVTINAGRIGHTSATKEEFFARLEELMELAKESLEIKRQVVEHYTEKGLYPYARFYLRSVKERTNSYWANHFSTIGILGMNEALMNFLDKDITTKDGQEFASEVLEFMRDKMADYQEETGTLYNLEASPAEGAMYRMARADMEKYPEIIFANDEEVKNNNGKPYYTNSTQLPVDYTSDIFEAMELQDDLQTKYTGGTVLHLYLGERVSDTETTKNLIRKATTNYKMPYITLTPTFSICPDHGYLNGEQETCQTCGKTCEVYSRVMGYIRPKQQYNEGKRAEYEDRKMFKVDEKQFTAKSPLL